MISVCATHVSARMSIQGGVRFVMVLAFLVGSFSPANAQAALDVNVGALLSIQPEGYDGTGGPYLDESLGGRAFGFSAGLDVASTSGPMVTFEVSSSLALEQLQSGRFVVGLGPTLARHRDTLLSILPGFRARSGNGVLLEPKGGISFMFGTPTREDHDYDDPGGKVALTAGVDVVLPVTERIAVVPALRYSHVFRGEDADFFGLGDEIWRVGASIRFSTGPR